MCFVSDKRVYGVLIRHRARVEVQALVRGSGTGDLGANAEGISILLGSQTGLRRQKTWHGIAAVLGFVGGAYCLLLLPCVCRASERS